MNVNEADQPAIADKNSNQMEGDEAPDYINNGMPHEDQSPLANSTSTSRKSLSRSPGLRQSPPRDGTMTPPGRKSVQFSRGNALDETMNGHTDGLGIEEGDTPAKDRRGQSLISKLKAFTGSSQIPSKTPDNTSDSIEPVLISSPIDIEERPRLPNILQEEDSDADADVEETADEGAAEEMSKPRRKRRMRRPKAKARGSHTAPNTPRLPRSERGDSPIDPLHLPDFSNRRETDASLEQRGHLSEGEGRDRLGSYSAWRRGSSWIAGSRMNANQTEGEPASPSRKPSNFRRFTGFGGGQSDVEGLASKRPLFNSDRPKTFGAHKWRTLKQSFKLIGPTKKDDNKDFLKSAELMAELRAGAPAALMLASMIQRDERGHKRIPVLLEQLKISITDSKPNGEDDPHGRDIHMVYRIELEYGNGLNRMKWIIHRSLRDFVNLHLKYKFSAKTEKYKQVKTHVKSKSKLPTFPRVAFPILRDGIFGFEDEGDGSQREENMTEANNQVEQDVKQKRRRPSFNLGRRKTSTTMTEPTTELEQKMIAREKQRKVLEQYLQQMVRWLIFRPDSNRMCKYLELSALGVRLAAEGSYHGKEGFLRISYPTGLHLPRIRLPNRLVDGLTNKWFLVRHSYIVCIESPENMHIYDVYMVDPQFECTRKRRKLRDIGTKEILAKAGTSAKHPKHHKLKLSNSERKVKLQSGSERLVAQFEESINYMLKNTPWAKANRFGSFAPVRTGVFAQWLVDGRDYMWNVSRAISMAKDVIYIHDWWLSPQLYMRRPAAISQKWRLDRLLQRKARQGVKVFIIIYRNVEAAIPIDSEFTKFSMLDLHPNIFVQRSPNQFKKNQFFYAHHEKICIVDHTVAFVGGLDLCFGRWDTPQHSVVDDKPTGFEMSESPKDADHCQLWPGKDYSNPRVQDFYKLSEPYAEMYDRSKTPRMPWHDVSMQVVGQPARDLTRHFVQRWNYVLRGRTPTRPTPFLLPPPDYNPADLEALGLTGTCEVQILRSACDWSLGLTSTEHSIMSAYCKMIEESEHFVYIENQFFITSCETMNTRIHNKIGDAIVERAVRAHKKGEAWRCIVIIPLVPGFQNTVDEPEGTSIRLIMQCQFRSICRGEGSIFSRLRGENMEPEDYVSFYSLRAWGKIGPNKLLVTEQLYIHAKVIIVDDKVALIGSANINERSMLGIRDSECAAIVRDTDMLWSTMDGRPYLVGRFAHTLRMRVMREHLGFDVDEIMEEERQATVDKEQEEFTRRMDGIYESSDDQPSPPTESERPSRSRQSERLNQLVKSSSFNHDCDWEQGDNPNLQADRYKPVTTDKRVIGNAQHAAEVDGEGADQWVAAEKSGYAQGRDSVLVNDGREVLVANIASESKGTVHHPKKPHPRISPPPRRYSDSNETSYGGLPPHPPMNRQSTLQLGLPFLSQLPPLPIIDDTDIGGPPVHFDTSGNAAEKPFNPLTADIKPATINRDCMKDPLNDSFFEDIWRLVAENNTKIFRRVFRCNPDNEVTNWTEYKDFSAYAERFAQSQGGGKSQERAAQEAPGKSGPPGAAMTTNIAEGLTNLSEKVKRTGSSSDSQHPLGTVSEWAETASQEHEKRAESSGTKSTGTPFDGIDEKAALHRSSEPPSPIGPAGDEHFPALSTSSTAEKTLSALPSLSARKTTFSTPTPTSTNEPKASLNPAAQNSVKRRRRGTTKTSRKGFSASDGLLSKRDAEEGLGMVQGHLVGFPYDWLCKEEGNSNWLYQVDQVAPLQI